MATLTSLESQVKALESELIKLQEADLMDDYYWELEEKFFKLRKLLQNSQPKKPEPIKELHPDEILAMKLKIDVMDVNQIRVYTLDPNEGKFDKSTIRAIQTLPTWEGILYRGISDRSLAKEMKNGVWKPQGISSFSKKFQIAKSFSRGENIIIWEGRGYNIHLMSKHPYEEEVVIPPSTFRLSFQKTENYIKYWEATLIA